MKVPLGSIAIAVVLSLFILFSPLPSIAGENIYIEDFTARIYEDLVNTTANWDTVAGELGLFPMEPTIIGSCYTPGNAIKVAISGDYAFVVHAGPNSGLQVIDISDPTNPTILGSYASTLYSNAEGIAVSGDYAFVANQGRGFLVIDISNPTNPTLIDLYNTPGRARDVAVAGDYAIIADESIFISIVDISDPTNITYISNNPVMPDDAYGVAVAGDHAFVACSWGGLQIIDLSDLENPILLGNCSSLGDAVDVTVSGDLAFVTDWVSGFYIVDISDPTNPAVLGFYDTPNIAWEVAVSGDYAFVAGQLDGLLMIDISDPTDPVLFGTCDTPGFAYGVAVSGDHAFVADFGHGLQIIDIADPVPPTRVGRYNTPGYAYDVTVSGDCAFVADGLSGLQIIDISDPTSLSLLGNYNTPDLAKCVTVSGDYAFVADAASGLQIIDISDPTNPTLLGTYDTPGSASDVAVSGDYAFVADWFAGLQIIDISNPTNPTILGNYDTPGYAYGVTVSGDYAFVADYTSGLQIIDISDPANPAVLGSYDTLDNCFGVTVSGDYAFVVARYPGLLVIKVFERKFHLDGNIGQSLFVDASSDSIFRARLTTTQIDGVGWELSANGGVNWQGVLPGTSWTRTEFPGNDLLWRSTLSWLSPGDDPTVTDLQIEWLVGNPGIDDIVDVPDDQGGLVRVHFSRSGLDFSDETELPISNYRFWRQENVATLAEQSLVAPYTSKNSIAGDTRDLNGIPIIMHEDNKYVQSGPGFAATSFPPGTWVLVGNLPATQQESYIHTVPTEIDSSAYGMTHTVFVVSAHTANPDIWYVSEPDTGYSVDNIAPAVPTNFAVDYNTGSGNQLSWDPCPDADFQCFNIYRSNDPDFIPSPSDLVHSPIGTNWSDPEYDGWDVYYKVTALDLVGNSSGPASPGAITGDDPAPMPLATYLSQNYPNPFNPVTTIRFGLMEAGYVSLRIYDAAGRLVKEVIGGNIPAGHYNENWDGLATDGSRAASGVYFYRLSTKSFTETRKMILLR